MGRKSALIACIILVAAARLSAQSDLSSFEFVENKGQWENTIQFKGELGSGAFYIQKKGFTVALHHPDDFSVFLNGHDDHGHRDKKKSKQIDYSKDLSGKITDRQVTRADGVLRSHAYVVEFVGANENPEAMPDKLQDSHNNYFIGNDPSKWASNVRIFNSVSYKNLYPGIDIRYYSENGMLKYDLILQPGSDPSKVVMKYTGADKLSVKNQNLIIKTSVGDVKELYPYSFQSDKVSGRKEIPCKYIVSGNTVRFQLGQYDKNAVLVIDPTLIFSSFTGSPSNQFGFTATPGPDGSLFSGGIVFGANFPVTPGAYQTTFRGGRRDNGVDIGIMKFSANGSRRLYATYIGGTDNEYPHSLFSDPQGNLVVMGRSYSGNYPGTKIERTSGSAKNANIVVTKLNADGSNIFGSLIIGGSANDGVNIRDLQIDQTHGNQSLIRNYGDDSRSEVILDGANNIYIAGQTQSADFPIRGGFQSTIGGQQDGVILKINPNCTDLIWSSYIGGSDDDGAFVLDINPLDGNVYVGGGTVSQNFPGNKSGTIGASFTGGDTDGFVAIVSNNGNALIKSTFIGSNSVDIIYGLKFDKKGFPYIMGTTRGPWPVINAAYGDGNNSQFVAKLEPDLSQYVYTTTFGNGVKKPNISPVAFLVDRCENLYISGWGGYLNSAATDDPYDQAGVVGMPISADAIQKLTDNRDFYFIVIEKNANQLLYGTYFGQNGGEYGEHVDGGTSRYDQQGVIYQAICANCGGGSAIFPTTPGVIGPVNRSGRGCNLAAVKISFNYSGVASGPKAYFNGVPDTVGCVPFTVNFRDTILKGKSYIWSFGDGSPDVTTTDYDVTHTYNAVGKFRVRLIAIDPFTCNEQDTAYTHIVVKDDKATLDLDIEKLDPCTALNYRFTNLSTFVRQAFSDTSFIINFGDGRRVVSGTGPIEHQYARPDTYVVSLVLNDTAYCNYPDSISFKLRVNPLVVAQFETPSLGCAPYTAQFTNTSLAGQTFEWNFGDGSPVSTEENPTHLYSTPGTYSIHMIARDEGTCNKIDDTTIVITVADKPDAQFSFAPIVPEQNKPTTFTNLSNGAVRYKWLFGDDDSLLIATKDQVVHQYNSSNSFLAELIAFNQEGCTDTASAIVVADILPLLDVPNAFTPGKFGKNSTIKVEGFGIGKMSWKIYNRWGQKVFETNDRRGAWDGTFNGKTLPVDVYTYTLDVQYTDGKTKRKTGDITLIR